MIELNSRTIKMIGIIGIIVMLLILTAIGIYRLNQSNKLNEIRKSLKHTSALLGNFHAIFTVVEDAETGQRGFLITGNESYLAPYKNALLEIDGLKKQLRQLTLNCPNKTKDINTLENTIDEKFAELKRTIELRRTKGFDAARQEVLTDHGKNEMTIIRQTLSQLYEREHEQLVNQQNEEEGRTKNAFVWLIFLFCVAIIFQVIMGLVTLRFLEREKLTTNKLREQAALLDLSHDAIMVRNLDNTIYFWNLGAEKMYGFRKDEAIGKVSYTLLNTKFPQPFAEIENTILTKGYWEGEVFQQDGKGRRIIVSSRHILKTDMQDKPLGILEINTDITAHKQAEQRQIALAEMSRTNQELEQFTALASHDLQEPLRAISGCLQILEKSNKDKLDKEAIELLNFAVDGASRMQRLINDLLSLARVSKSEAVLERMDLEDVLRQALQNIQVTVAESGAIITHDPLPVVKAEKTLLVQLFQNLLANAIKFCKDKRPEIHISANKQDGKWRICVRDNGIGFEKAHAQKIFEPFKRLHTRDEYPGTGIGLAVCAKIVERHAGTIWAESEPGKGATFCFTITDFESPS